MIGERWITIEALRERVKTPAQILIDDTDPITGARINYLLENPDLTIFHNPFFTVFRVKGKRENGIGFLDHYTLFDHELEIEATDNQIIFTTPKTKIAVNL